MSYSRILAACGLFLLNGCTVNSDIDKKVTWQERVERETAEADIRYKPGVSSLGNHHRASLNEALSSYKSPQDLYVRLYVEGNSVKNLRAINKSRVDILTNYFVGKGILKNRIEILEMNTLPDDEITAAANTIKTKIDRYIILPKGCPGWKEPMNSYIFPEGEANFGCANAYNTAHMIADPRTLIRGNKIGDVSAVHTGKAINNYEADKVKALQTIKSNTDS